ncbi:MAG TPA: hypothetical protein VFC44_22040 [Candidatus Saccharimonadales bacterium]|nr:hypothetical protein [Candidatus Saccharimonadales bacterium]
MIASAENEIESQFARLSPASQLTVLERLVKQMRKGFVQGEDKWESELEAMARDPEIQREFSLISTEFSVAEADGLGKI